MQVDSLGRYRIEKELGRGAMGRVFLAYDPHIDRRVAIKTVQIFASLPDAERVDARERFLREARSAGKLLHPGIVTIFDVGEADGVPYLAMELVDGQTMDAFCREGALLPVPEVVALLASAAEALGYAHERGIVHRDVKPANLMRTSEGAVKVMDFGLAKTAATSLTHDGALLGTPSYMSPEQVRGETPDGRSDLFSLAVVACELLTGQKPFGGDSISSVLYRIVNEPPQEASLQTDRVAPSMAAFLAKALGKNRDDRFPDGATFAAAIRRAHARADATDALEKTAIESSTPIPAAPPKPKLRSRWVVPGTLAVVTLVAAGFWVYGRLAPQPIPMLEARVRTEPEGTPVRFNGEPLAGDRVRFAKDGPYGVLTATQGCRETKHRVELGDAGNDIVMVLDPVRAEVVVDPGVTGARISINGTSAGAAPATLDLDLCRDNTITAEAAGYQQASATIRAKASPLDARNAATSLKLEAIPAGRVILPAIRFPVEFFIDGQAAARSAQGVALPAGSHVLRAVNREKFLDVSASFDLPAGGTASPRLEIPGLSRLVVQTFPPNCRVSLKPTASEWRELGEAPLQYELVAGPYTVRVESPQAAEPQERAIVLKPGDNPPVRISFGRPSR